MPNKLRNSSYTRTYYGFAISKGFNNTHRIILVPLRRDTDKLRITNQASKLSARFESKKLNRRIITNHRSKLCIQISATHNLQLQPKISGSLNKGTDALLAGKTPQVKKIPLVTFLRRK